jgi:hypothetical protein
LARFRNSRNSRSHEVAPRSGGEGEGRGWERRVLESAAQRRLRRASPAPTAAADPVKSPPPRPAPRAPPCAPPLRELLPRERTISESDAVSKRGGRPPVKRLLVRLTHWRLEPLRLGSGPGRPFSERSRMRMSRGRSPAARVRGGGRPRQEGPGLFGEPKCSVAGHTQASRRRAGAARASTHMQQLTQARRSRRSEAGPKAVRGSGTHPRSSRSCCP